MSKLIAGDALRDAHSRLADDGRLGENMLIEIGYQMAAIKKRRRVFEHPDVTQQQPKPPRNPAPRRAEIRELDSEFEHIHDIDVARAQIAEAVKLIADNRDRQIMATALLRSQAEPLAGKVQEDHRHDPGRPTSQFIAKEGGEAAFDISVAGKGERAPVKRYTRKSPWQAYREIIGPDILEAFDRFADDAEAAGIIRVTANYDGSSGASRGPRTGGLGDVDDSRRDAYARHQERMSMLTERMDTPHSRVRATTILAWAILRERLPEGRVLTMVDLGRRICPERSQEDFLRGVAFEAIDMVGRVLVNINHELKGRNLRIKGGQGLRPREDWKRMESR